MRGNEKTSAEFANRLEKRFSTMCVKGEVDDDSAMSKAVSLPAAIALKLILEGKIKAKGVQRPTLPEIYQFVLKEMGHFGYNFVHKTIKLNSIRLEKCIALKTGLMSAPVRFDCEFFDFQNSQDDAPWSRP